uniref:Elongation of very long chain fatty acids protein n=1 Tax=Rhabditophanes sp. KR3021 TaxID=114890 RepID=A0AC35U8M1_9BILA
MSVEVDKFVSFTDVFFYPNNWEFSRTKSFMGHWLTTSGWVTLAYIIVIFGGQRLMKSRDAFKLNTVFAYWNIGFSIFSAIACYYLLPELVDSMQKTGFFGSYCYNNNYYQSSVTGYWGWLFVMSKAPELGDTLFLVLRKKPVIFMHWYHHALTFYYAQLTYSEEQAWARWSLVMNLMVHTVMYL